MLGREEPSSASRAEDTRVPSGSMRLAVLVLAEVACPTTNPLCVKGAISGPFGRDDPDRRRGARMPKGLVGPGVTSPKSRPPGCRAGHAGYESFPLVLPGPYFWVSMRSWR